MKSLQGKTLFITGASRGIGLAIAKKAALLDSRQYCHSGKVDYCPSSITWNYR